MALFRGIQEYIALDANNITLVFDSGNIVNISGNIFLYPPQGHPILYNYSACSRYYITWHVRDCLANNDTSYILGCARAQHLSSGHKTICNCFGFAIVWF